MNFIFYPDGVRNFWITTARFKKKILFKSIDELMACIFLVFTSFDYFIEHYFEIVLVKSIILRF